MKAKRIAIIHYSAPPVVGGVEAVIKAHVKLFSENDYEITIITGRGDRESFPQHIEVINIPEIDSQHPAISDLNTQLEKGEYPPNFDQYTNQLHHQLSPILKKYDHLIIHNIFTKHFNLPLTAAIHKLIDQQIIQNLIAWCHDFTWTSPNSRDKVFPKYPWNLLRTYREEVQYVVVSKKRQAALADLFGIPSKIIKVIYNGIDPFTLLGITLEGQKLIDRLDLLKSDLNIIMPVRVTQAKNIEYALQVVEKIKSQDVNLKLVITGPPDPHDPKNIEYFESLKTLRSDLDLENNLIFIYESGPEPNQPHIINNNIVADLYRVSDLMFMPSHREGFGMPVLEAGMLGLPVVSTPIPASEEIAENDALIYHPDQSPEITANQILERIRSNPLSQLRIKTRMNFTWESIFYNQIIPLLKTTL